MKEWLVSYLTFSKKERVGILVLLSLILAIWLLPEFYKKPEELDQMLMDRADSSVSHNAKAEAERKESTNAFRLFHFDPNTITDEQWEVLGLKRKTISTIRNYLSKGGKFREASDLEKIYGMRKEEAERLVPYVRIIGQRSGFKANPIIASKNYPAKPAKRVYQTFVKTPYQRKLLKVDVNLADSATYESLPGIGARLATRIIRFRDALGGFHSIDQMRDVYGINDTVFNLIAAHLILSKGVFRKVKINEWDIDSLDMHPYIQKHEARAIVKFRKQHGPFNSPRDLDGLGLISEEWINRMLPYLQFD